MSDTENYKTSDCTESSHYYAKLNVLEDLTEEELETLANERDSEECLREFLKDEIAESSSEDDLGH